jgi:hypothetical protein
MTTSDAFFAVCLAPHLNEHGYGTFKIVPLASTSSRACVGGVLVLGEQVYHIHHVLEVAKHEVCVVLYRIHMEVTGNNVVLSGPIAAVFDAKHFCLSLMWRMRLHFWDWLVKGRFYITDVMYVAQLLSLLNVN